MQTNAPLKSATENPWAIENSSKDQIQEMDIISVEKLNHFRYGTLTNREDLEIIQQSDEDPFLQLVIEGMDEYESTFGKEQLAQLIQDGVNMRAFRKRVQQSEEKVKTEENAKKGKFQNSDSKHSEMPPSQKNKVPMCNPKSHQKEVFQIRMHLICTPYALMNQEYEMMDYFGEAGSKPEPLGKRAEPLVGA